MNENTKNNQKTNIKPWFRRKALFGTALLLVLGVTIVMHVAWAKGPAVPEVELDSHFDLADLNKDGQVSREEFRNYLEVRKVAAQDRSPSPSVKICPNSGLPCTKGDACSGGGSCCSEGKSAGGACCSEGNKSAKQEGGCCKMNADGAKQEGECCGGGAGGCCSK